MQVMNDDANAIEPTMELAFFVDIPGGASEKLFGCTLKDGKVTLTGDPVFTKKFKMSKFLRPQTIIICIIIL